MYTVAEAKTATEVLLQAIGPHANEAAVSGTVLSMLKALETIELFKIEEPSVLELYSSTCDKLTAAVQTTGLPLGERQPAWEDGTIDEKSWSDHVSTLMSCITALLEGVEKKKHERPLLCEAILAAAELKNKISISEDSTPGFDILSGTLLFLLNALDLLQSIPSDGSEDLGDPLRKCYLKCRSATPVAEQQVFRTDIFLPLIVALQGLSNTFVCSFLSRKKYGADAGRQANLIFGTIGTHYLQCDLAQQLVASYNSLDTTEQNLVPPVSDSNTQALPMTKKSVNENCSICLRTMAIATTPCEHEYHAECLSDWQKVANSCPQCRGPLIIEGKEESPEASA